MRKSETFLDLSHSFLTESTRLETYVSDLGRARNSATDAIVDLIHLIRWEAREETNVALKLQQTG